VSNREEVDSSNDITASAESNEDPVTRRGVDSRGGELPKSGKLECLNAKLAQGDLKGALVKAP